MGLIERRDNSLAGCQRLIPREAASDRTIEVGARNRVLKPPSDSQSVPLFQIEHEFCAVRTCGVEINWHEDARDADLVIFKAVVSGVQVRV